MALGKSLAMQQHTTSPLSQVLVLLALAYFCISSARALEPAKSPFEALITENCDKEVIFLGESGDHMGGMSITVRAALTKELIERCGFSAIAFESQIYDLLDFERRVQGAIAGKSPAPSQDMLRSSITWHLSGSAEFKPLLSYLYPLVLRQKVRIAGLDVQVGGFNQPFSQNNLGQELSGVLGKKRAVICEKEIRTQTSQLYDAQNPFDDASKSRLQVCSDEIQAALAKKDVHDSDTQIMANSFAKLVKLLTAKNQVEFHNLRDAAMFANLMLHRARLLVGHKLIVWCATVHALKSGLPQSRAAAMGTLAHEVLGKKMATIAITARTGAVGHPPRAGMLADVNQLKPAGLDWLENAVTLAPKADFGYIGTAELSRLAAKNSQLLTYTGDVKSADWSQHIDGLIVLREEHPKTRR